MPWPRLKICGPPARPDTISATRSSSTLPPAARDVFGDSEERRNEILDQLIEEGCQTVLAHLQETRADGAD